MTQTYKRFDGADHLHSLGDVATYLEIAIEDTPTDPSALPRALAVIARSRNLSELARRVGMSRDGLSEALTEDGDPRWSTIVKVTEALNIRFELHPVA